MLTILSSGSLVLAYVCASVGCILGMRQLIHGSRLESKFLGEIFVAASWVLPSNLIAIHGFNLPNLLVNSQGNPFILVGSTFVAAVANILMAGIITSIWPNQLVKDGAAKYQMLALAILILLVAFLAFIGIAAGRSGPLRLRDSADPVQVMIGIFSVVVLLGGSCLNHFSQAKNAPLADPDFSLSPMHKSRTWGLFLAAISLVLVVYTSPLVVKFASPLLYHGEEYPYSISGLLTGCSTTLFALTLALPGLIVSMIDIGFGRQNLPIIRQFVSAGCLVAFPNILGVIPKSSGHAFARSLYYSSWMTIVAAMLVVIFFHLTPIAIVARVRGSILTGIILCGIALSLTMKL